MDHACSFYDYFLWPDGKEWNHSIENACCINCWRFSWFNFCQLNIVASPSTWCRVMHRILLNPIHNMTFLLDANQFSGIWRLTGSLPCLSIVIPLEMQLLSSLLPTSLIQLIDSLPSTRCYFSFGISPLSLAIDLFWLQEFHRQRIWLNNGYDQGMCVCVGVCYLKRVWGGGPLYITERKWSSPDRFLD